MDHEKHFKNKKIHHPSDFLFPIFKKEIEKNGNNLGLHLRGSVELPDSIKYKYM